MLLVGGILCWRHLPKKNAPQLSKPIKLQALCNNDVVCKLYLLQNHQGSVEHNVFQECISNWCLLGEIPCLKLYETSKTLAFMDIQPIASGHALVIPKYHGAKLHDIPDEYLEELLPIAKKIALASELNIDEENGQGIGYNVLQNNGRIAHQLVDHVHVHLIPKRDSETGLSMNWPMDKDVAAKVKEVHAKLAEKLQKL